MPIFNDEDSPPSRRRSSSGTSVTTRFADFPATGERSPHMAASLAGARSLDDRRRRRLAKKADTTGQRAPRKRTKGDDADNARGSRLPLRKIISKHRWKILALGLLMLAPIAGLGVAAFRLDYIELKAGPAVARLLDPVENRLGRAWGSFALITSSAICVLIYWVRSRSPADFGGRFGIWLWAAAACFLFSAAVATEAHLTLADTVLYFRLVHFPQLGPDNTHTLCWFAPAALFGALLVRSLHLDMRRCWSSVLTLWFAVIAWVGSAFLRSQTKWSVDIPHRELAASGAAMVGHVSLLISLLLHARFVLYENAAPPPETTEKEGWGSAMAGFFRKLKASAAAPKTDDDASSTKPRTAKKPAKAKKTSTRKSKSGGSDSSDEIESESTEEEEMDEAALEAATAPAKPFESPSRGATIPANAKNNASSSSTASSGGSSHSNGNASQQRNDRNSPPSSSQSNSSQKNSAQYRNEPEDDEEGDSEMRIDPGDHEALKGLSKRERRKLQKQWRDQQRGE